MMQSAIPLYWASLFVLMTCMISAVASVGISEPASADPTGTIHVDGQPVGIAISLDGIPKGNLPTSGVLVLEKIPAGEHLIIASLSGYEPKETYVTVPEGQIAIVRIQLPALLTGILEVQSVPKNVQVYLDDEYKGISPLILSDVTKGNHTVFMRLAGYRDWSSPIYMNPGDRQIVSGTLDQMPTATTDSPIPTTTKTAGSPSGLFLTVLFVAIMVVLRITR